MGAPFDHESMEKSEAAKTAWKHKESPFMNYITRSKYDELVTAAMKETPGPQAYHKFKIKTAKRIMEPVNSLPLREIPEDEDALPKRGDKL